MASLFCISTDEFALAEVKQVQNEGICLILIELITEAEFIMLLIYRIGGWLMNLPNALTLFRFVLIGIFPYLYFLEGLENNKVWAFAVFILAGITDVLDGFIARRFNLITKWGKLMDPLADKLMLITVLICLFIEEVIPVGYFNYCSERTADDIGSSFSLQESENSGTVQHLRQAGNIFILCGCYCTDIQASFCKLYIRSCYIQHNFSIGQICWPEL